MKTVNVGIVGHPTVRTKHFALRVLAQMCYDNGNYQDFLPYLQQFNIVVGDKYKTHEQCKVLLETFLRMASATQSKMVQNETEQDMADRYLNSSSDARDRELFSGVKSVLSWKRPLSNAVSNEAAQTENLYAYMVLRSQELGFPAYVLLNSFLDEPIFYPV